MFTVNQSVLKVYVCRGLVTDPEQLQVDIPKAQITAKRILSIGCLPIIPCIYFPQFLNAKNPNHLDAMQSLMIDVMRGCDCFVIDEDSEKTLLTEVEYNAAAMTFPGGMIFGSVNAFLDSFNAVTTKAKPGVSGNTEESPNV